MTTGPSGATLLDLDPLTGPNPQIENPFARLGEALSSVALSLKLPPLVISQFEISPVFEQALEAAQRTSRFVAESIDRSLAPLRPLLAEIAKQGSAAEALERAGWLPHDLIPINLVELHLDATPARLSAAVEQHFSENWLSVEKELRERYAATGIDYEAMAAMDEALRAHCYKLYRASCRTVFPEIERVAREHFYNGLAKNITNLRGLRSAILNLPATDMHDRGVWGFRIFEAINQACYARVADYESKAPDAAMRMPNRHAIAHGLLTYASARDSLNTFFIADFLFNAMALLVRSTAAEEAP